MLDEKDLQLLSALLSQQSKDITERMDAKFQAMEQRMDEKLQAMEQHTDEKFQTMEHQLARNTAILMDAEFSKKFALLSEALEDVQERMVSPSRVSELEDEVKLLKLAIRQINQDVQELKKAQ
ncbi:MAG: hypothetical protein KH338_08335 [Oscillospiraceae bacterium]|nr:hypothetical protein [Oscillospiraceae bacterium]